MTKPFTVAHAVAKETINLNPGPESTEPKTQMDSLWLGSSMALFSFKLLGQVSLSSRREKYKVFKLKIIPAFLPVSERKHPGASFGDEFGLGLLVGGKETFLQRCRPSSWCKGQGRRSRPVPDRVQPKAVHPADIHHQNTCRPPFPLHFFRISHQCILRSCSLLLFILIILGCRDFKMKSLALTGSVWDGLEGRCRPL